MPSLYVNYFNGKCFKTNTKLEFFMLYGLTSTLKTASKVLGKKHQNATRKESTKVCAKCSLSSLAGLEGNCHSAQV